jgi:hypothetical protein
MGYFLMGSLPLLILNHDTPLDARFIRGFFRLYYLAVMCTGTLAASAYVYAGSLGYAAGVAAIVVLAVILRAAVLPHMDALRTRIENADAVAIAEFRRIHITGMAVNFVQLATLIWGLFRAIPGPQLQ